MISSSETVIEQVKVRSRAIFALMLFSLMTLSGASLYMGYTTGEFRKNIVEPMKKSVDDIAKSIEKSYEEKEAESKSSSVNPENSTKITVTATSSSNLFVNFEKATPVPPKTNQGNNANSQRFYIQPTIQYYYPQNTTNYEDALRKQDEWWKQVQEENRKTQAEWAEWDRQMEEFKKQGEQKMKDFDQKYNFPTFSP